MNPSLSNTYRATGVNPGGAAAETRVDNTASTAARNRGLDLSLQRLPGNTFSLSSINAGQKQHTIPTHQDWRVRITLPGKSSFAFRKMSSSTGSWMDYLRGSNAAMPNYTGPDGVVFPYTPSITVTHNARYSEQALTHSNYKNYFYDGSDVAAITVAGLFTCQNGQEALYLMAAIQFLRACTKMYFGTSTSEASQPAGTPPPIVRLSGYGAFYLPDISCVVTSVQHIMPDDCDYIKYMFEGTEGWMPTASTLTATLQPVVSRQRQASDISLDAYVKGDYTAGRTGGNGGII
jgi:hypothetical protein